MKAQPVKQTDTGDIFCEPSEATHVWLACPGPFMHRRLPVVQGNTPRRGTPCWTWNGSTDKPTLKPSILTGPSKSFNRKTEEWTEHKCHSYVTDGKIQFLTDCTHEFAGQTLDLLEVDE